MGNDIVTTDNFTPSVFAQAEDIMKEEHLTLETKKEENHIELDKETLEICIGIPFDIAALATKIKDLELDEEEKEQIAKVWLKPLQRLLSKYPNSDVVLAASATLGIALEKYIIYVAKSTKSRNSAGNEGQGQDKLPETANAGR